MKEEVHGDKADLFLDEFNKFFIVHASKKSANKQEYDSQPYPKMNLNKLKIVTEYKQIVKSKKNECYALFLPTIVLLMAGAASKCIKAEIVYPSFLIRVELVKRFIECVKNKWPLSNDENFYRVKINPKALTKEL